MLNMVAHTEGFHWFTHTTLSYLTLRIIDTSIVESFNIFIILIPQCSDAVGWVTGGKRYLDTGAEYAINETTATITTVSANSIRIIQTLSKSWSRWPDSNITRWRRFQYRTWTIIFIIGLVFWQASFMSLPLCHLLQNEYECTIDQELAELCCIFIWNDVVTTTTIIINLFGVITYLNPGAEYDSLVCVRTFLPNFITIQFEMTEA